MKFVAERAPGVPIPKVHCAVVHKSRAYIVSERIHGEALSTAWKQRLLYEPGRTRQGIRPAFTKSYKYFATRSEDASDRWYSVHPKA